MPPSAAVGWVLELKAVVKQELSAWWQPELRVALHAFEDRVDRVALEAFDLYVAFREELANLKVKEARRHVSWIVDRLNGESEGEPDAGDSPVRLPTINESRVRGGVSP